MTTAPPKLLIVDDGDRYVELAHHFLRQYTWATRCELPGPCWGCARRAGCTLTHAHDLGEAQEALARHSDVDAVLLDLRFELPADRLAPSDEPDLDRRRRLQGLDILRHLRRQHHRLPVILLTSHEALAYEDAASALEVDEFVTLAGPDAFDARAVSLLVERVLARGTDDGGDDYLLGGSAKMARLYRDALTLARTSLPMLVLGETGTGKSALAERVIHRATRRRGPFVAVDLAALPPALVAAELFGTARGAFSGAVERAGRIEAAHGGTLFLDEIGNLPLEVQRTLLLVLEEGRVTRLGESTPRPVDVKLVAATNADLPRAVAEGTFRRDLYARLNPSARLALPPLRERIDDLDALMAAFVRRTFAAGPDRALLVEYLEATGTPEPAQAQLVSGRARATATGVTFVLQPQTRAALRAHPWPGNLRELRHVTASAALFALADAGRARGAAGDPRLVPLAPKLVRELLGAAQVGDAAPEIAVPVSPGRTLHEVARRAERAIYERLYRETAGDFAEMARRLLGDAGRVAARKVRLRYNQLGLRVRSKK